MCPSLVRVLWASNLTRLSSPSSQTNSSDPPAVPTLHFPLLSFFLLLTRYCFISLPSPRISQVTLQPMTPSIKDS